MLAALEEIPHEFAKLRQAADARDAHQLQQTSHKLKTGLRFFGVESAADQAQNLEIRGREGRVTGLDPAVRELEQQVERVEAELRRFLASPA